jgi:hypothetical protein
MIEEKSIGRKFVRHRRIPIQPNPAFFKSYSLRVTIQGRPHILAVLGQSSPISVDKHADKESR